MSCISIKLDLIKGSGSGFRICQCILLFPQTSRPRCFRFQCWRPPHLRLYIVGAFKLANPLVNFGITAYTERWSALAPAGVLM